MNGRAINYKNPFLIDFENVIFASLERNFGAIHLQLHQQFYIPLCSKLHKKCSTFIKIFITSHQNTPSAHRHWKCKSPLVFPVQVHPTVECWYLSLFFEPLQKFLFNVFKHRFSESHCTVCWTKCNCFLDLIFIFNTCWQYWFGNTKFLCEFCFE